METASGGERPLQEGRDRFRRGETASAGKEGGPSLLDPRTQLAARLDDQHGTLS
jgi:hypothetical protein